MPAYRLLYKKPASKEIEKFPTPIRKRLRNKLEWFAEQANPLDFAEPLTKPADAQYRFRVGSYRILFDVEDRDLIILHIQHRRDIYRSR